MPAVEYSKSFITSVVLGKDVVPRIGLNQMEALRADLINAIQRSVDPKVGFDTQKNPKIYLINYIYYFSSGRPSPVRSFAVAADQSPPQL